MSSSSRTIGAGLAVALMALATAACDRHTDAVASGSTPPRLTIEDILRIDQTGPPFWSADGRQIGFLWGPGTERNLWAADARATAPGRPGADTLRQLAPLVDRAAPIVSPDWKQVAYVSKKHVWTVPLLGGRPVQLTKDEAKYSALIWSPDSTRLAFIATRNDQDDIGVVSASGGPVTMIAGTPRDEDSPIWAPGSDRLAFIRRFDDWKGYEVWVSSADGKNQHPVVKETYDKGVEEFHFETNAQWAPDGKRLTYLSNRSGFHHVAVVSADGGEPIDLTKGSFVDYSPSWSPDGARIAFVSSRAAALEERHIWSVNAAGGDPVRLSGDGLCARPAWSPDGKRVAYQRSTATEPNEIVVQDAAPSATAVRLTESRPSPELTASFVAPEPVTLTARDGYKSHAVLLRPADSANGRRPALMYFHGKGNVNTAGWGGLSNYAFHQYLVQRGYAILFVNWRGDLGYGSAYEQVNYRDYGGGEIDDVRAAKEFLQKEVGADPERVACWGGSYGGYMTMLAITKAPDICSAGISLYGVSDWITFVKQNKVKLWRERLLAKLGDPDKDREVWERANAMQFVAQAHQPLLILQGMDDDGVVPAQGETLYDALHRAQKNVQYVAYVGEGHGFRHTGSERDLFNRVTSFLTEYNGPRVVGTK